MNNQLSSKQHKAINALLVSSSVIEAARLSEIPERTLRRWLSTNIFIEALNQAQGEIIQNISRYLTSLDIRAIQALSALLDNAAQPGASIRLRTAVSILDLSSQFYEKTVLEERINRLERIYGNEKQ